MQFTTLSNEDNFLKTGEIPPNRPWATAPRELSAAQAALVLSSSNGHHVYADHSELTATCPATSTVWKLQLFITTVSGTAEEVAQRLEALPELGGCKV